jgi:hypothetical protein
MLGSRGWASAALLALLLAPVPVHGAPGGAGEGALSALAALEDPAASPSALLRNLVEVAPVLAKDGSVSTLRAGLIVCARGGEEERRIQLEVLHEGLGPIRGVLERWGVKPPTEIPETLVVIVRGRVPGDRLVSPSPGILLVRRGPAAPREPGVPPTMPSGPGGCWLSGEVASAARAHHDWLSKVRARQALEGPWSVRAFLARRLVEGTYKGGLSPWANEALAAAAESRARKASPADPLEHLPGPFLGKAKAVTDLFGSRDVPPAAVPLLARILAASLEKSTDPASILASLGRVNGLEPARTVLGESLPALVSETCGVRQGTTSCEADGRARCPLCRGLARLDVECGICKRTGQLKCKSCGGESACWSKFCNDGIVKWDIGGRTSNCRLCEKGHYYCKGCDGKGKVACAACRGKGRYRMACPVCASGALPCPDCPFVPEAACAPCGSTGVRKCPSCPGATPEPCPECEGTGAVGCEKCKGLAKSICAGCSGTGEEIAAYVGEKTPAVAKQCTDCNARGWDPCDGCDKRGRKKCPKCGGKGISGPGKCQVCGDRRTQPCPFCAD